MTPTNPRQWEPVHALIRGTPEARSAEMLRLVLEQFDVLANPRYQKSGAVTYCNIFVWDCTRALGCEIPHWVKDPTIKAGRRELNANATLDWLVLVGPTEGWREVDQPTAALRADGGFPTVAAWRNPNPAKSGHIAMLLAPRLNQIRIAQAGARNLFDAPLAKGFGDAKPLRFFTHE